MALVFAGSASLVQTFQVCCGCLTTTELHIVSSGIKQGIVAYSFGSCTAPKVPLASHCILLCYLLIASFGSSGYTAYQDEI